MTMITARDPEILAALDKTPLTAAQLLKWSEIFANGRFSNERKVRARLQHLSRGPVHQARYTGITGRVGSPNYYFLTPFGFRLLHGRDVRPHSKHAFQEIGVARQQHTYSLAEFIVATMLACHRLQVPITEFYRENSLKLTIGRDCLYPDCAFTLQVEEREYHFMVEIDCGSEPIHSERSVHAWQRKIELYEALAEESSGRFRVLVLSTRNHHRLDAILALAAKKARNPNMPSRRLFLAAPLDDYVSRHLPLFELCFRDHREELTALLPTPAYSPWPATPSISSEAMESATV